MRPFYSIFVLLDETSSVMATTARSPQIRLAELRRMMESVAGSAPDRAVLPFGIEAIEKALPGSDLSLGAAHEFSEKGPARRLRLLRTAVRGRHSRAAARPGSLVPS